MKAGLLAIVFLFTATAYAAEGGGVPWNHPEHLLKFKYFTEQGAPTEESWNQLAPAERNEALAEAQEPAQERLAEVREYYSAAVAKWDLDDTREQLAAYKAEDLRAVRLWLGAEHAQYVQGKFQTVRQALAKARGAGLEQAEAAALGRYLTTDAVRQLTGVKGLQAAQQKAKNKKGAEWKAGASSTKLKDFGGKGPLTGGKLAGFYDGSKAAGSDPDAQGAAKLKGGKVAGASARTTAATTVKSAVPPALMSAHQPQPKAPPKPAAPKYKVPAEADRGPASYAKTWWKGLEKEQEGKTGFMAGLKKYTAKTAQGLISFSSLADVEGSYHELKTDYKNGASAGTLVKGGAILAKDTALAAVTFIPGANLLKSVKAGEGAIKVAKAGAAVTGMTKAEAATANAVAKELQTVIKASANADDVVKGVTEVGKRYGVEVAHGGTIGESVGSAGKVVYNGAVGKAHEVVHVVQQVQTRATLGVGAEASVNAFEKVAYAQHEMFAKEATHLLGTEGASYMSTLGKNVASFETALANGTVPQAAVSFGAKVYGYIPSLLGTSQAQIAANLAATGKGVQQGGSAALNEALFGDDK
ncbi:MAG: hypothetical protein PHV33_13495 [Elusimicrobiales bacterium]|nr:hypothetical protein [Elusimicrobiales bacterium]